MRSILSKGGGPILTPLTLPRSDIFNVGGEPRWNLDSYRPIRNGTLREILDDEFQRCYRFEGLSDLLHDLKGLIRKVVVRNPVDENVQGLTT